MSTAPASEIESASIVALTDDGRGIADNDGKTVFVDGALPGERVSYTRTRKRRTYVEARLARVLEASPQRVDPRCRYFGLCGGCSLQHLAPAAQRQFKQAVLLDHLLRVDLEPAEVLPPLAAPVWGYRRRARLGVRYVARKGRVLVGFRERFKPYVTDMASCEILPPHVAALLEPLARTIERLSLKQRLPQVEVAVAEGRTALVLRVLDEPTGEDTQALREFAAAHDVTVFLQRGGLDTVTALCEPVPVFAYSLPEFDLRLEFLPTDFLQVNAELNRRMVSQALRLLDPRRTDQVLELFCGLGNFSLPLARRAERVTAVDGSGSLIARARHNARRNGIDNVQFHIADLFAEDPDAAWLHADYAAVLLDPPRAGAARVIEQFGSRCVPRVVYISCHPESLARDAEALVGQHGYRFQCAGIMDMFPHTAHVESIALFVRD